MSTLIGKKLGNYRVTAQIGRGGTAIVYRARQETINRDVAIKVIDTTDESRDFVKRFEREAQTMATLSHPHIIKVFEYGEYDPYVYLVMEFMPGGTLSRRIRRQGALPVKTIYRVMQHLTGALDYAHQKNIIHRDLKPQNVLLDENGNVILTDFGIARLLNRGFSLAALAQHLEGLSEAITGTPAYMSPEQWRNESPDHRADVYSLGVMLYEMLTARLPYTANSPQTMLYLHMYHKPPLLSSLRSDLPADMDFIINKALAKAREDRFNSVNEMMAALRAVLATGAVPGAPGAFGAKMATRETRPAISPADTVEEWDLHFDDEPVFEPLKQKANTPPPIPSAQRSPFSGNEDDSSVHPTLQNRRATDSSTMDTPSDTAALGTDTGTYDPSIDSLETIEDVFAAVFNVEPLADVTYDTDEAVEAEAPDTETETVEPTATISTETDDAVPVTLTDEDVPVDSTDEVGSTRDDEERVQREKLRAHQEKFKTDFDRSVRALKRQSSVLDLPEVIYLPASMPWFDVPDIIPTAGTGLLARDENINRRVTGMLKMPAPPPPSTSRLLAWEKLSQTPMADEEPQKAADPEVDRRKQEILASIFGDMARPSAPVPTVPTPPAPVSVAQPPVAEPPVARPVLDEVGVNTDLESLVAQRKVDRTAVLKAQMESGLPVTPPPTTNTVSAAMSPVTPTAPASDSAIVQQPAAQSVPAAMQTATTAAPGTRMTDMPIKANSKSLAGRLSSKTSSPPPVSDTSTTTTVTAPPPPSPSPKPAARLAIPPSTFVMPEIDDDDEDPFAYTNVAASPKKITPLPKLELTFTTEDFAVAPRRRRIRIELILLGIALIGVVLVLVALIAVLLVLRS